MSLTRAAQLFIRPTRAEYKIEDLEGPDIIISGKLVKRTDHVLANRRGYKLQCSFFHPATAKTPQPCVIYLHGKGGSRMAGRPIVYFLLPKNVSVFLFDFSGCGKSEGDYVTLGYYEREDIECVLRFLKSTGKVKQVGLWGRSMGAVTGLLYCKDFQQNISCMVLDSPFHNLQTLVADWIWDQHRVPRCLSNLAYKVINWKVRSMTGANLIQVNPIDHVGTIKVPAFFGVGKQDNFTKSQYIQHLFFYYRGVKEFAECEGEHDTPRPESYYIRARDFMCKHLVHGPSILNIDFDHQPTSEWDEEGNPIARPPPSDRIDIIQPSEEEKGSSEPMLPPPPPPTYVEAKYDSEDKSSKDNNRKKEKEPIFSSSVVTKSPVSSNTAGELDLNMINLTLGLTTNAKMKERLESPPETRAFKSNSKDSA